MIGVNKEKLSLLPSFEKKMLKNGLMKKILALILPK